MEGKRDMGEMQKINLWPQSVPYAQGNGPEDTPSLTPYLVENNERAGAVIVCPGGGYRVRAAHEGEPIARWLNSIGIHAFVLSYRVAPYTYPSALLDARRAIRTVRHRAEEWRIDPGKIGILGFSAGGHLASTAGTHYDQGNGGDAEPIERESSRPDALILCYPVITFGEYRHHGSMIALLGETPEEARRLSLSNEKQVTADTPPTFLWHTADDEGVPVENSMLFAQSLSVNKVPFELHVYESGRHGLGLAEDDASVGTWSTLCGLWLKKRGF
jgi:acetyl esterase/lipase